MADEDYFVDEVPTTMSNVQGNTVGMRSMVLRPREEDVALFGTEVKVCGDCKYFERGLTAKVEVQNQRFFERLVLEEGWKTQHLCSPPEDLGLCGAGNGEMMTGRMHKACDQYREARGRYAPVTLRRKDG